MSLTVTLKEQDAVAPEQLSVATQFTVLTPTENEEPDAGVHTTGAVQPLWQLDVAVGAVKETEALHKPGSAGTLKFAGQAERLGAALW